MTVGLQLSVVIAVQHAQQNLPAILSRLDPARHPDVEYLFCTTPADPETPKLCGEYENAVVLSSPMNSLIPQLWATGIKAARAETVALSSAHLIPCADWVEQVIACAMTVQPGIGGVIVNAANSDAKAWAIYLLRYIEFSPPQQKRQLREIAADNALYRRSDIMQHADLLETGFWEPSFHARFRQHGKLLTLNPELRVMHHNQYTGKQFFCQRLAHGKAFGRARATQISTAKRRMLIALSPLLPIVFLTKIVTAVIRHGGYTSKLFKASGWLLLFLLAWGLGESQGYLSTGYHDDKKKDKKNSNRDQGPAQ